MKIGYSRVSTKEQHTDLQRRALEEAGCERIFEEKLSGKNTDRPEFQKMLEILRAGDVLIVWKLDRLARSTPDLVNLMDSLSKRQIGLISLSESWADTTTPQGRLMITIAAGLAQFERETIRERQAAGIAEAKRQGKHLGRRRSLDPEKDDLAVILVKGGKSLGEVAKMLGVSRRTIRRRVEEKGTEA